jgi:multisubunit Na+/H+ antiporter MnhC subunit
MERSSRAIEETLMQSLRFIILVIGIIVISIFLRYTITAHRGILGVALGGLSIALLIYWLGEARKQTKGLFRDRKKSLIEDDVDIIEQDTTITVAGRIPGPSNLIRVGLHGRRLKIFGGSNFSREIKLKEACKIDNYTYKNGVLEIQLRKSGPARA